MCNPRPPSTASWGKGWHSWSQVNCRWTCCERPLPVILGSLPKKGDPNIDPKYYSPYYGDPQNGTPNFGKPPFHYADSFVS